MEFYLPFQVGYFSVGADYLLRLSSLLKLFQEAAILHAAAKGFGDVEMADQGLCWVLYRVELEVFRYPRYQEELRVVTRLGGRKGFKAYRYFEVLCGEELVASAVSVWFSLDMKSRRPVHVKGVLAQRLLPEGFELPEPPSDKWKPVKRVANEWEIRMTTRCADIDTNGHVNNAVYADYLETAIARREGTYPRLKTYKIQFNHEITSSTEAVMVVLSPEENGWQFQISAEDMIFAGGEASLL
jgi:acyl-ACP thioesterase